MKKYSENPRYTKYMQYRPWGYYNILHTDDKCQTKFLSVNKNSRLSYQSHKHRSEHWFIVSGIASVTIEDQKHILYAGDSIDIPQGTKHRIEALDQTVELIEVQTGTYFGEDDIIRYEDDYNREEFYLDELDFNI
jgi:mannose-6-phosphate isomerase-like protein (cupin superfamily)